jgi:AraC-like DNA-binding protein
MPSITTLTTDDVDELLMALHPVGKPLTITGRGDFTAELTRIEFHHLWMQRSRESLPRCWGVEMSPTRTGICFPTAPGPAISWRGVELAADEVLPLSASAYGQHMLSGRTDWGSMSLLNEQLASASLAIAGRDLTPRDNAAGIGVPAPAMARLRRLHAAVIQVAETAPEIIECPDVERGLEQTVVKAMIACLDTSDVREDTANIRRDAAIIRRFCKVAEARANEALYLSEVCGSIGVNARTLSICCQEHFGVSPRRFLVLRRLHLAQRALHAANPVTGRVTEIATRYGFWELGRFSAYYKGVFGESPSTTLQRLPV